MRQKEAGTNLKIRFATDSRINERPKIRFFRKFQKNEQYKKRIVRFFLQFLKPKRLLSRPLFSLFFKIFIEILFYFTVIEYFVLKIS